MKKGFVTEISLEDFKRLNLIGYKNTRVDIDEHSHRNDMLPYKLNEEIDKELEFCKKEGYTTIVVAIHNEPTEDQIQHEMELYNTYHGEMRKNTKEEAFSLALFSASYILRFTGFQTYSLSCGVEHVYSNRDYWYDRNGEWQVKKKETKAIYLIHLN